MRARHGLTLIGWRNLRGLFKALRAGENLVLFCDGGYRPGDVPVEFLGEPTTFPTGPATLSARSGAPMLPVACYRTTGDRFTARGLPLIRASSEEPAEIYRATQALADELGTVIAADPGQWYMFRPIWPQTDGGTRAGARRARDGATRRGLDPGGRRLDRCEAPRCAWACRSPTRWRARCRAALPTRLADLGGRAWYRLAPGRRALVAENLPRVADRHRPADLRPRHPRAWCSAPS